MKPTETTETLLIALKQIDALDLEKLFASAVDVAVLSYTEGRPQHMGRVSIPAEFFSPVRDALRDALILAIDRRRESLERELADVNKVARPQRDGAEA